MFAILSFVFTLAHALPAMEPTNFCSSGCSAQQLTIWEAFEATQFRAPTEASVYSGECYHTGMYKNTDTHHGVFYISKIGENYHASGSLGFYFKENPYAGMTVADAEKRFTKHQEDSRILVMQTKSMLLNFSTPDVPILYWFRHSEDDQTVNLVGVAGPRTQFFCALIRHSS